MMADLTDSEIKKFLRSHGQDIGPINDSTRETYLRQVKSIQKRNNIPIKSARKSEPISNKKPESITTSTQYDTPIRDTNSQITADANHNRNFKINSISPQPRNSYENIRTEPIYNSKINKYTIHSRQSDQNSSLDSDLQALADESYRRDLMAKNVSPMFYSNINDRRYQKPIVRHNLPSDSKFQTETNEPQINASNNTKKWYNGSLNTISNYFVNRQKSDDLMDISDGDLSDNDSTLMTRLRKNYFKKTGSNETDKIKKNLKADKASNFSFISLNQLPNILLVAFVIFSVVLFSCYFMMKTRYSHIELDMAMERLICKSDSDRNCFTSTELPQLKFHLARLYDILSEYSGEKMCEFQEDNRLPFTKAREILNYKLKREQRDLISEEEWSKLMKLIINLPVDKLNIVGYTNEYNIVNENGLPEDVTYLEGLAAKRSLICRFKMAVVKVINWISYLFAVLVALVVLVVIGYGLNLYRIKRKENYERKISELREIVSNISGLLQDQLRQSEFSTTTEKFLSLVKIRSILQQTYPKLRDNRFWDQVKRFMYKTEPLIELKETMVHGEILQWKCRAGWQGSAVQSDCQVKFEKGPTECLKIRNMDVQQFDDNAQKYLRRELATHIKDAGEVKDIQFLTKGPKVIVYVMCASREVAGKAFRMINANYFNGNLLNVKFIRLDKYLERFPDSRIYVK